MQGFPGHMPDAAHPKGTVFVTLVGTASYAAELDVASNTVIAKVALVGGQPMIAKHSGGSFEVLCVGEKTSGMNVFDKDFKLVAQDQRVEAPPLPVMLPYSQTGATYFLVVDGGKIWLLARQISRIGKPGSDSEFGPKEFLRRTYSLTTAKLLDTKPQGALPDMSSTEGLHDGAPEVPGARPEGGLDCSSPGGAGFTAAFFHAGREFTKSFACCGSAPGGFSYCELPGGR